jgi:membrane protease YdiL (CAAX protease family)
VIASELSHEPPPYAGLTRRFVAGAIDLAIAWAAYSIAITVLDPDAASEYATTWETVLAALIVLSVATLWLSYFVFAQWRWGQTLGMRALGIRVVGDPGERLSWSRALMRSLLLVVDCVLAPVLIPLSKRKQRLGDRVANTVVLVKRDEPPEMPTAAGALDTGAPVAVPPPTGGSTPPPGEVPPAAPPNVPATWGPGRVGVGILVLLVLSVIEVAVVSIFDPSLDSLGARLAAQALLAATLVGVALGVAADRGFPGSAPRWRLGLRRPLRSPYVIAGAAYVAYLVFALAYSAFVHPHQRDITRDLGFGHGDLGTVAAGILIIGAAPISEEIFFRGFIFGGFRRRLSFPVAAILSAVIFGLFHYTGSGSLAVVPQLAFLGLALCWVYEETGSIYPTIALHMVNNAFAFAVLTS